MGEYIYCTRCRIPIECHNDGVPSGCDHPERFLDYEVFYRHMDDELDLWNAVHPKRPVDYQMAAGNKPNPYREVPLLEEYESGDWLRRRSEKMGRRYIRSVEAPGLKNHALAEMTSLEEQIERWDRVVKELDLLMQEQTP